MTFLGCGTVEFTKQAAESALTGAMAAFISWVSTDALSPSLHPPSIVFFQTLGSLHLSVDSNF